MPLAVPDRDLTRKHVSGRSSRWINCKNDRGAPTATSGDAAGTFTITFSSRTAPMQEPTQHIQNELMDSPTEMGALEHREQKGSATE